MNYKFSDNIAMWPSAIDDPDTINYWINTIVSDEIMSLIIQSKPFKRLYDISFLGALDYTYPGTEKISKQSRSRAEHSLHVAALAAYVAEKRNYSPDLKRQLVIAALLHDIGHAPLSHSAEPLIKETIGYGHHEAGEQIIDGKQRLGKDLSLILKKYCDLGFIHKLLNMNASKEDGGDLFYSPINIDTIDGITRSHTYFTGFSSTHSKLAIAHASFIDTPKKDHRTLDAFWIMKERVYSGLINDEIGIISDKTSEIFFMESSIPLEEGDLYKSEKSWQQKHKSLFIQLNEILKSKVIPSCISNSKISFTKRTYSILPDKEDSSRYSCKKESKVKVFAQETEDEDKQQIINLNGIKNDH
ncbi:HD domain-containing protein [Pseudomonas sp. SED1]|uniref:HD domain-containing protein n=1 Tax=Pseudomonas sp. SED1 TaxID=3056845 RepID=UPI00296E8837|nr:HD domain-containing protein [Pseudomonas sp. SED1]MDY0831483.1 HD domain-containing protein [Pseudomonas sp. SED1]